MAPEMERQTGAQHRFRLTRALTITAAPAQFAPGVEPLTIDYDIAGLGGDRVVLRVRSAADPAVIYERELQPDEKTSGTHRGLQWDGKGGAAGPLPGAFIDPLHSPYEVSLVADAGLVASRQVKVEIAELTVALTGLNARDRVIMNDPAARLTVAALVKLRKSDGSGVATPVPLTVKFTFNDPATANATRAESFEHRTGHFLGKASDASAVHWEAHTDCPATSSDGFKADCSAATRSAAPELGAAKAHFKPSGVGGDDFKLRAAVLALDGSSELAAADSQTFTCWRRIEFSDVYTMDGETYIDTATTDAEIGPAFETDAFVEYARLGAVTTLSPTLTVKYIGLYKAGGGMSAWPADSSPASLETAPNELDPTAAELAAYAYTGSDPALVLAKNAAAAVITAKAQAWFNRVVAAYSQAVSAWFAAITLPATNALLAVQYYHPKLSNAGDGATSFYPAGITINLANPGSGLTTPGHPDQATWREVQGFNRGNTSVIFKNYPTAARLQIICRHEIGHATSSTFRRREFGTGDHSASGLMTYYGASNTFSAADLRILRGYA